jgi:hypothetical protein
MEKNWIEKIKEAVRIAMNKGLNIEIYSDSYVVIEIEGHINFYFINNCFNKIITPRGYIKIEYTLTDREKLELQALILSIKEYKEDMAISEFEEFISDKKEEITNINDLDNDEE